MKLTFPSALFLAILLTFFSEPTFAQLDSYPESIATKLAEQRAAEISASTKLPGQEANYLFSRKRWAPGSRVLVAFNGGTTQLHKAIAQQAALWEKFANISLDFGYDAAKGAYRTWSNTDTQRVAHIRIGFSQPGYWSYVGTDSVASFAPANSSSMNFEGFADSPLELLTPRWKTVVIHEFGHALGLNHEHQHPTCGAEFRWEPGAAGEPSVYAVFKTWQGWSPQTVDVNLRPVLLSTVDASKVADKQSIMFYAMPAQAFVKGEKSLCFIKEENKTISKLDGLGAQLAYPKSPTQALEIAFAYAQAAASLSAAPKDSLTAAELGAVQSRVDSANSAKRPLLYIHIQRESDREKAAGLQSAAIANGFFAPGIENVSKKGLKSGMTAEVRYFRAADASSAQQIANILGTVDGSPIRVVQVKSLAAMVTRNLVEVWLP